uniref:Uncharacterized protein n=1 Tax=Pseudomonas fluorescens (strain SBW25) TaxID=216595 RepID=A0A0G4E5S5_PSEFS|nr:hypothetical protein PQBR57_0420 [Pseudomonas fluorescens SBW25]
MAFVNGCLRLLRGYAVGEVQWVRLIAKTNSMHVDVIK